MSVPPTGASDAQPSQAVAASRLARPRPACTGTALETFERQVLVFPLLVVVLACASFLFGGTCTAWQWWTAVAAVVAAPFVRKDRQRAAVGAAGLFALLLFALRCLIPPLVWDSAECPDMLNCHLPMVQLLIEGWNPVSDPLAEGITASLGLDPWGMAPLHVAFSMKALAVFSAVTYTFVGDPYALTFPLPVFLWLDVFLAGIRLFRGFSRCALVAAFVFVLPMVPWRMPVDLAMAFASCGLLLVMQDALRGKKCDWFALTVWGAWMATLKLNGALGLAAFAAAFAVAKILKGRGTRKAFAACFAAWTAAVILVAWLVSWNPLGTSWRRYGHPLYPYRTVDAERFPAMDLAWDMQCGNDDLREIGKAGRFAHAYLSPEGTVAFYRWKLRRRDFNPSAAWWVWIEFPALNVRIALWLLFAVLLTLSAGRPWGIAGLLLLVLVPEHMVGYTRYQPWLSALGCLAAVFGAEWLETRMDAGTSRRLSAAVAVVLCLAAAGAAWNAARNVECKAREAATVRKRILAKTWLPPENRRVQSAAVKDFAPRYDYRTCTDNANRLRSKMLGIDTGTTAPSTAGVENREEIEAELDERKWRPGSAIPYSAAERAPALPNGERVAGDEPASWTSTPFGYWVPDDKDSAHVDAWYAWNELRDGESPFARTGRRAKTFLHAWAVAYPKSVWRKLLP